jgi:hypothetical protein
MLIPIQIYSSSHILKLFRDIRKSASQLFPKNFAAHCFINLSVLLSCKLRLFAHTSLPMLHEHSSRMKLHLVTTQTLSRSVKWIFIRKILLIASLSFVGTRQSRNTLLNIVLFPASCDSCWQTKKEQKREQKHQQRSPRETPIALQETVLLQRQWQWKKAPYRCHRCRR